MCCIAAGGSSLLCQLPTLIDICLKTLGQLGVPRSAIKRAGESVLRLGEVGCDLLHSGDARLHLPSTATV